MFGDDDDKMRKATMSMISVMTIELALSWGGFFTLSLRMGRLPGSLNMRVRITVSLISVHGGNGFSRQELDSKLGAPKCQKVEVCTVGEPASAPAFLSL